MRKISSADLFLAASPFIGAAIGWVFIQFCIAMQVFTSNDQLIAYSPPSLVIVIYNQPPSSAK